MCFQYDNSGTPVGFIYNGVQYFYLTNAMGDVIAITEANGNLIAQYLYDDWGKLIAIDTADEEASTAYLELAEANPLRYRGYYYDNETGYYYLQSRYYDPEICRFINADIPEIAQISKDISNDVNLFAYCNNNPVNSIDADGHFGTPIQWACAIIGGLLGLPFGKWLANKLGYYSGAKYIAIRAAAVVGGAALGWFAGSLLIRLVKSYVTSHPEVGIKIAAKYGPKTLMRLKSIFGLNNSFIGKILKSSISKTINNVWKYTVKPKHLLKSTQNFSKFNTNSLNTIRKWVVDGLKKQAFKEIGANSADSYYIIIKTGKVIGTKGEKCIKIVFTIMGKIITLYPTK